jgi:hypothetical protein
MSIFRRTDTSTEVPHLCLIISTSSACRHQPPSTATGKGSLTERGGANLEHRYTLNYAEQRPTELNCTAVTGGFSISAGHVPMRTSLGVKGSQVQILSSRRRDRAVSPSEMPPDLCPDLGKGLLQLIINGSSIDLAGWPISACARLSGANLEHGVEARRNRGRVCSRLLSLLATVGDRSAQSGSDTLG